MGRNRARGEALVYLIIAMTSPQPLFPPALTPPRFSRAGGALDYPVL